MPDGKVFSAGYDDKVREIVGTSFTSVPSFHGHVVIAIRCMCTHRSMPASTSSQPKSIAVTEDSAVVVIEANKIEVIKSAQKVFELSTPFSPSAVTASKSTVAVGGDVRTIYFIFLHVHLAPLRRFAIQDFKVYLYNWDGKSLTQTAVLNGNKGVVSALKFSPDLTLLASGDVRVLGCFQRSPKLNNAF
jgi:hypothetical protein